MLWGVLNIAHFSSNAGVITAGLVRQGGERNRGDPFAIRSLFFLVYLPGFAWLFVWLAVWPTSHAFT